MSDVECPYCHAEVEVNTDDGYGMEEGPTFNQECPECEKTFGFTTSILVSHEAFEVPCLNGEPHEWRVTQSYPLESAQMRCQHCSERRAPCDEEYDLIVADFKPCTLQSYMVQKILELAASDSDVVPDVSSIARGEARRLEGISFFVDGEGRAYLPLRRTSAGFLQVEPGSDIFYLVNDTTSAPYRSADRTGTWSRIGVVSASLYVTRFFNNLLGAHRINFLKVFEFMISEKIFDTENLDRSFVWSVRLIDQKVGVV